MNICYLEIEECKLRDCNELKYLKPLILELHCHIFLSTILNLRLIKFHV
jgi:hypothetical protein